MERIYVIEECNGVYSDSHTTPIKAYRSYDKAKAECDKLNKEMDEIQCSFDKLEDKEVVEKNINEIKEYIFKQTRPLLFDKWYQIYHSEDAYSWNDEWDGIENEYYDVTDEAEKNVVTFIEKAKEMKQFSEIELSEIETYLLYINNCDCGNIYEGLPSYYVSNNSVELVD